MAKCHEKTANARNHFQHTLSKQLVDENQAIAVESLKIKNMLKNRKLSKHIADAFWHSLLLKIAYKAKAAGKHHVAIDTFFPSSKIHFDCGFKADSMPLGIRHWDCPNCGKTGIDRDINAARNIKQQGILKLKAAGLSVSACAVEAALLFAHGMSPTVVNVGKTPRLAIGEIPTVNIACVEKVYEEELSPPRSTSVSNDMVKPDWLNPNSSRFKSGRSLHTITNVQALPFSVLAEYAEETMGAGLSLCARDECVGNLSHLDNKVQVTTGSPKGSNPYGDGAIVLAEPLGVYGWGNSQRRRRVAGLSFDRRLNYVG